MSDEWNSRPENEPAERMISGEAETTRAVEPVVRHRRSMSREGSGESRQAETRPPVPFSRVSGRVRPAAGEAPEAGETPAASGGGRQIVRAPGYTQRQPLRSAVTGGEGRVRRPEPQPEPQPEGDGKRRGPVVLVCVVLVLALLVLGFLLIPEDNSTLGSIKRQVTGAVGGLLGREPSATRNPMGEVVSLSATPDQGQAPADVMFNVTTRGQVDGVRLADGSGNLLPGSGDPVLLDNADSRVWTIALRMDRAFEGEVHAQLLCGENWVDSPVTKMLSIAAPLMPTAEVVEVVPLDSTGEDAVIPYSETLPQVYALSADTETGEIPLTVNFSFCSELTAEDLRLVGSDGESIPAARLVHEDRENQRVWQMTVEFTEPLDDELTMEVLYQGQWVDTYETIAIYAYPAQGETADTDDPDSAAETVTRAEAAPVLTMAPTEVPPLPSSADQPEAPAPEETAETGLPEDGTWLEETLLVDEPQEETQETPETLQTADDAPTQPAPETAQAAPETEAEPVSEPRRMEVAAAPGADVKNKVEDVYTGVSKKAEKSYTAQAGWELNMAGPEEYLKLPFGVLTFRSSSFRQNAAYGKVDSLSGMSVKWRADAGSIRGASTTYWGIGYGSQPVLVKWGKDVRDYTNIKDEKRNTSGLKEVIVAGEDGNIYFLDLADGEPTRNAIPVGYPLRGTPSLSPRGLPFMAVGQYARKMANKTGKIGLRCYNLLTQKEIGFLDGTDNKLKRPVSELSSFNTSPLMDANSDMMITAGSNGLLYMTRLGAAQGKESHLFTTEVGSDMLRNAKKEAMTAMLRVQAAGEAKNRTAVESSLAAYQHYIYYADMGGYVRCVDANDLGVKWMVQTEDAVEAAVALDLDSGENLWLYTATTLQNRKKGDAVIRCLNAETGAERWKLAVGVAKGKNETPTPGAKASPVVGTGALDNYVYFTLSNVSAAGAEALLGENSAKPGVLICVEKETGRVCWSYALDSYSYSSPVAVYDEAGSGWIIQASSKGVLYLLDGKTGSLVSTLELESTVNGSPAVYNGTLVIGTQGKGTAYIYGIALE